MSRETGAPARATGSGVSFLVRSICKPDDGGIPIILEQFETIGSLAFYKIRIECRYRYVAHLDSDIAVAETWDVVGKMTAHPDTMLTIREQIVDDPVSGFVFKFVIVPGSESPSRVLFKRANETIWREYIFDRQGDFSGATTRVASDSLVQPTLRLVK
jgi:hypothetical protein